MVPPARDSVTVYLDWNATSPRHESVLEAMRVAEESAWANPASVHQAGRAARRIVEDTREQFARLVHLSPRDIVFTGGGTEANHLALSGARWLVTSRLEHPSIVAQAESLRDQGAHVQFVQARENGTVDLESLQQALQRLRAAGVPDPLDPDRGGLSNANTALVALSAVNHETGVIQPIEEAAALAHENGARLHVDAVQLLGRGDLAVLRHVDSLSVAAHKIRGPKGLGIVGFACGWTPLPLGRGGAQERGLRPGTIDALSIAGLGAALTRLEASRSGYERAAALGLQLAGALEERGRGVVIHGSGAARLNHVVNFRAEGFKGDELVAALDLLGICVSSGSACSAGTAEPSPVIETMLGREAARGAVRVSFGEDSTSEDLRALVFALTRLGVLG